MSAKLLICSKISTHEGKIIWYVIILAHMRARLLIFNIISTNESKITGI